MGLIYPFKSALRIISTLTQKEHFKLLKMCSEIQIAENELNLKASPLLDQCASACKGLCCRNIILDSIIGLDDFIYILLLDPSIEYTISSCLQNRSFLYSSNCIFLSNGVGPCLFPSTIRPQVCITTFCFHDHLIKREIAAVRKNFFALEWFIRLKRTEMIGRKVMAVLNRSQ
jgi:hypothetical protein